jgi:hypothetical protein
MKINTLEQLAKLLSEWDGEPPSTKRARKYIDIAFHKEQTVMKDGRIVPGFEFQEIEECN